MTTTQSEYYRGLECASRALAAVPSTPLIQRMRAVHESLATALAAEAAACRSGCAHCCHFPVGVTFAEARHLADAVRDDRELCARVGDEALATADLDWPNLVGRACPLLQGGACARYEQRPIPCRALASEDADACAKALAGGPPPPRDERAWWRGLGASAALDQGHGRRELRAALAALLAAPDDEVSQLRAFAAARAAL